MTSAPPRHTAAFWWTATAIVAVVLFALANNGLVYNLTSPDSLDFHELLRKFYSVVAFGGLGFCAARAAAASGWGTSAVSVGWWLAGFSAAIEVVQALTPPPEGLLSNAVDVACGWLGGWLGAIVSARLRWRGPWSGRQ